MAYTLLNAINLVFKRVGTVAGDATAITSLTDSARQRDIDVCIQVWNEAIRAIYDLGQFAGETSQGSITLVTGQREYDWASDFEQIAGDNENEQVFICATNNLRLTPYPGGYQAMFNAQPNPANWQGTPYRWADNTNTKKIRVDYTPTTSENGLVYTYNYTKRQNLSLAADTFPFSDSVVDQLVSPVSEVYRQEVKENVRNPIVSLASFTSALRFAMRQGMRGHYGRFRRRDIDGWKGPFVQ